jgi:hypothetical protein
MQRAMHQWVKGIISRDHAFAADIREGSDNLITSREHSIQKEKGMLDGQSIMKLLLSKRERPPPSSSRVPGALIKLMSFKSTA